MEDKADWTIHLMATDYELFCNRRSTGIHIPLGSKDEGQVLCDLLRNYGATIETNETNTEKPSL